MRVLRMAQEARALMLKSWDVETREDFGRVAHAGQTKADKQSPTLKQLAPLSVWRTESSAVIIC